MTHLECGMCAATYPPEQLLNLCPACARPLLARYDLPRAAATLTPEALRGRPPTLWRYAEMLPVRDPAMRQRVIDEALVPYLHDQRDAWELDADGRYRRVAETGVSAQQALLQRFSVQG